MILNEGCTTHTQSTVHPHFLHNSIFTNLRKAERHDCIDTGASKLCMRIKWFLNGISRWLFWNERMGCSFPGKNWTVMFTGHGLCICGLSALVFVVKPCNSPHDLHKGYEQQWRSEVKLWDQNMEMSASRETSPLNTCRDHPSAGAL